jgi:hypothetical protein
LNYKNKGQFRQDELKKKREEQQVEIRKQKREESIAKRRNLVIPSGEGGDSDEDEAVATQLDSQVCCIICVCLCRTHTDHQTNFFLCNPLRTLGYFVQRTRPYIHNRCIRSRLYHDMTPHTAPGTTSTDGSRCFLRFS